MMYVEYPELTERERVNAISPLDFNTINISVADIQNGLADDNEIEQLNLLSVLNRPVYKFTFTDKSLMLFYADSGDAFQNVKPSDAKEAAQLFAQNSNLVTSANGPEYLGHTEMDQWTVYGGFNEHRPLHKVSLNNAEGTILYISSSTGEVLRDTHRWERMWNWVGSTIHWIYPMQLRKHSNLWVNVVIAISIAGVISVVSGTIVGILRLRLKRRYKDGNVTPYTGVQKLHHVLGITFTLFITMFIVSGLFSMNPFGIFNNKTSSVEQVKRYTGGTYDLTEFDRNLENLKDNAEKIQEIKELSWQMLGGEGLLIAKRNNSNSSLDPLRTVTNLNRDELEQKTRNAISQLLPDSELVKLDRITEYDNYYYTTHNRYMPLPIFRARFSDTQSTWYYVDATTSEVLARSTQTDRIKRWLYNGLHSLDFRFLLVNRPLWDIIVIFLSITGVIFSLTSLVISWRRLRKNRLFKTKKLTNS
ncbi:MAG: hypothetical protein ACI9SP_000567 [Arenicella sp.]|jgi:hypothetical protein